MISLGKCLCIKEVKNLVTGKLFLNENEIYNVFINNCIPKQYIIKKSDVTYLIHPVNDKLFEEHLILLSEWRDKQIEEILSDTL